MPAQQGSLDWIRTIEGERGYAAIAPAHFARLIDRTEKYAFFHTLTQHVRSRQRVLEAGCGLAFSSFALARRNVTVTALDVSSRLIDDLKRKKDELGWKHVLPVQGDIFELAQRGRLYDAIFSDGTYEHFRREERQAFLWNIRESLSPGGKFIVSVPNVGNPLFGSAVDMRMPWMQSFTPESLRAELEGGGFRVVETGYSFVNPGFEQWLKAKWMVVPVHVAGFIFRFLPKPLQRVFAVHLYCVAAKNST